MAVFLNVTWGLVYNCSYTLYEASDLANQSSQKLGVFNRKLEGSHFILY